MRRFVDLLRFEPDPEILEFLGYHRVLTPGTYVELPPDPKKARKVKEPGVFVCKKIEDVKRMGAVRGALLVLQTRIDAEAVSIMRQGGSYPVLTLDLARKRMDVFAWNMHVLLDEHYPPLLASWAKDATEMRSPREVAAVGIVAGMTPPQALDAVSTRWEVIV